jgi:hypothetical protein
MLASASYPGDFPLDICFSTFVVGITALLIAGTSLNLPRLGRVVLFALMIGAALIAAPDGGTCCFM